ncbi:helix-turn-helix domain-containing protein [Bacteroides sp. 51]|uniref:helix-turn-helix domain-containing protein n=1 Tax=Bacteroides sp. 51 TaxID=2302938 RepID=UPI0013D77A88|nr:helix-turn-helix domain-containing protein [Bacteroides sp. 51]NDV84870.1 AraC family transcriptional regulator [Bacteroides sp. 51]
MSNLTVKRKLLIIVLILLPISSFTGNPFLHMIGKPYADYLMELKLIHHNLDFMEQSEADSLMAYMEEAARVANNREWKVEEAFFRMAYRFRYKARMQPGSNYTIKDVIEGYRAIYVEAKQLNDTLTYLRALRGVMNAYVLDNDYDRAFEAAKRLNREFDYISVSRLPEKLFAYREIANMHYRFRNYVDAEVFFRKIVEEPEANRYSLLQPAYNGLGLIYRYHYNDYDRSDEYFRKILTVPHHENSSEAHYQSWRGIVNGNLGNNLYQRKMYDEAIPLLETSRKMMAEINDYTYASSMAALLANIYFEQKKLSQCKRYIDIAVDYTNRSYPNAHWAQIYPVMAKYYTMTGDFVLAAAYQDSALAYQKKEYQEYDALKLVYVEQRMNRLEQKAKNDELLAQHIRARNYRNTIIYITVGLLLVIGLLIYAIVLYRRKRAAYRVLVKKSQEWAAARKTVTESSACIEVIPPVAPMGSEEAVKPKVFELVLMEQIRQLMSEDKVYINPNLTLGDIAAMLGVNRNYTSATINRCTGSNFANFINEYRISEAISIMSVKKNAALTIDQIAYSSGFNDRKSFYRAFKKITGLAPSEFRENMSDENESSDESQMDAGGLLQH